MCKRSSSSPLTFQKNGTLCCSECEFQHIVFETISCYLWRPLFFFFLHEQSLCRVTRDKVGNRSASVIIEGQLKLMEDNTVMESVDRIPKIATRSIQIPAHGIVNGSAPPPPLYSHCLRVVWNKSFKQTPASCLTSKSTYPESWVSDFASKHDEMISFRWSRGCSRTAQW